MTSSTTGLLPVQGRYPPTGLKPHADTLSEFPYLGIRIRSRVRALPELAFMRAHRRLPALDSVFRRIDASVPACAEGEG